MNLTEKINDDLKAAMKAGDKLVLEAIRAIKSELLLAKTAEGASDEISEEQGLKILQKMVKQRRESAEIYKSKGRTELYETEIAQAAVIEKYLPAQISDDELTAIVKQLIAQLGATSVKDMGKVIGAANKQLAGRADGKSISEKVKSLLA